MDIGSVKLGDKKALPDGEGEENRLIKESVGSDGAL
ncbi:MAG: hypothetical protein UX47_C0005G0039 [Candidatus Collierbacteria bacterium GW2011_GWA2_46_26]|uniref:Uncharacterized protein n=1 Tax=Candidatus Collierbacteria bacterium GW2011_GWA2_46_26 TaxID=1618381 RepID=A0A0G1PKN3_9BACT|nr:MAG: hypothetical protein UW29_C0008G0039 [Candidatus Collierbacteria bacterium GW2011_GWC2_44_13]KKU33237.1 MAG: hypothetical protein UX47_C0005G0039 [Candidatus Collierbacteria bacterium GW2011_GWA2_46_26]